MKAQELPGAIVGSHPVATPFPDGQERGAFRRPAKRALDLAVALTLLAVSLPLMFAIAIAVKLTSPGPALFRQLRVGEGGRFFISYKFRSMYTDAEARQDEVAHLNEVGGPIFKTRDDPRMTSLGRWLRKTSLDELPQLFNVVRGEMSMVGPRPGLMREVLGYEAWQLERLTVKPGLTGLWQVSGRSDLPFEEMIRLDQEYIRNWSLRGDVWLLIKTLPAVLSGRGAY